MDDLHVWEEIDMPKTIDEKLAMVDAVLEHIDEKTPKGVWSREVEVKGCWLDVQESLEDIKAMGDKDYLEFNYGTDDEPKIGRMKRSQLEERIDYKLETYYGTTNFAEAIETEFETPATKVQNRGQAR